MPKTVFVFAVLVAYAIRPPHIDATVLIFKLTRDKLIVAADSRGIPRNPKGDGPPDDTFCKIAVFSHQFVFASVGAIEYPATAGDPVAVWKNIEEGRLAVKSVDANGKDPEAYLQEIADDWGQRLVSRFNSYYQWHPQNVIQLAEIGKGVLTAGAFAYAKGGKIYFRVAIISFNQFSLTPVVLLHGNFSDLSDCWSCGQENEAKVCVGGEVSVPKEFCLRNSPRAIKESQHWAKLQSTMRPSSRSTRLAIRLADLTVTYDTSKTVGGRIDAIELSKTGRIHWVSRKCNCPENQD